MKPNPEQDADRQRTQGKNEFIALPNNGIGIILTQGYIAEIDADDFNNLGSGTWYAAKNRHVVYAKKSFRINGKPVFRSMHSLLAGTPKGMMTDHVDGNGLNNRRGNLRICSNAQNQMNRKTKSGNNKYRGVWKDGNRWSARICTGGKNIHLGCYPTAEDAALAYNAAAIERFGEFAQMNKIGENHG